MTDYTKENNWVHDMVIACGQNPNSTDINGVALYHIINLIRQDEREACAVACEYYGSPFNSHRITECVNAIRARGTK